MYPNSSFSEENIIKEIEQKIKFDEELTESNEAQIEKLIEENNNLKSSIAKFKAMLNVYYSKDNTPIVLKDLDTPTTPPTIRKFVVDTLTKSNRPMTASYLHNLYKIIGRFQG